MSTDAGRVSEDGMESQSDSLSSFAVETMGIGISGLEKRRNEKDM